MEDNRFAVWYASAGCLPDTERPEYTGSYEQCAAYVLASRYDHYVQDCNAAGVTWFSFDQWKINGEPEGPLADQHNLYGYSIEPR